MLKSISSILNLGSQARFRLASVLNQTNQLSWGPRFLGRPSLKAGRRGLIPLIQLSYAAESSQPGIRASRVQLLGKCFLDPRPVYFEQVQY